jgi:hypothetical protein
MSEKPEPKPSELTPDEAKDVIKSIEEVEREEAEGEGRQTK